MSGYVKKFLFINLEPVKIACRWHLGLAQQTRLGDGLPAIPKLPFIPSERRGGRRFVCCHR